MSRTTAIALAAAASLTLGAAALTPGLAEAAGPQGLVPVNYSPCYEEPSSSGCRPYDVHPQDSTPTQHGSRRAMHEHGHKA